MVRYVVKVGFASPVVRYVVKVGFASPVVTYVVVGLTQ